MVKKLTTVLGLALMAGSVAFASQAPSANSKPLGRRPAAVQATPSTSQQHQATTSVLPKKHKKHHKKPAASRVTSKSSIPTQ
jgi:hypothetical protein